MFVSKNKTAFSCFVGIFLCIFGGSITLFWFLGVILSLAGKVETLDNITGALLSLSFTLVGILITYLGIKKIRLANKAKILDNIFRGDIDGEVTLSKIAVLMGMSDAKFFKLFQKLVAKGYTINASLNNDGEELRIVLNGGNTKNIEYIVVKCEGCGASVSVRKGFVGKCKFCGNDIKG